MTYQRQGHPSCQALWDAENRLSCLQIIDAYLREHTATRRVIEAATGIHYGTVCGRISDLKDWGRVVVVKKAKDPISGMMAQHLTSDPEKFPNNPQLRLNWEES